ncbi:MAG: PBP1A family penicillin-binding protein [Actinomycetota bacterium]|nr:PBP1A family penicillin-binding protein [Actinomycetota bacterium]
MATRRVDASRRKTRTPATGREGPIPNLVFRLVLFVGVMVSASLLFALALLAPVGAAGAAADRFSQQFQSMGDDVDLVCCDFPERSTIYGGDPDDPVELAKIYETENRRVARLKLIPEVTRNAVLAIEDARFYEHSGVDTQSMLRALLRNLVSGEIEQGASTITQQLVRNAFESVGTERTVARKIEEARMAIRLEQKYSKDRILEFYLNEVYFGRGVYGIATAAEHYFGKGPQRLTLAESALLAGLIQSPETYSPLNDRDAARARRDVVIRRMLELEWITRAEADEALRAKIDLSPERRASPRADKSKAPFFVRYITRQLLRDERLGSTYELRQKRLFQGGLKIYTTFDPSLDELGRNAISEHLPSADDPEAAIAAVDTRTGAIKALVGGRDFNKSQVNLATGEGGTGRQPGSAFKMFTLAAAFENGIPAGKVYDSAPGDVDCGEGYGDYDVVNAGDSSGSGFVNLTTGTQNSINAVFVRLASDVGHAKVLETAKRLGIKSDLEPPVCSLTLGTKEVTPLEMASAYATIANDGVYCKPFAVARVVNRHGRELLNQEKGRCGQKKMGTDPKVAAQVIAMLQRVVCCGTGQAADLGSWPVFGKTGTTNDSGNAWFTGCTAQICTATWVGHTEGNVPMRNVHGITVYGGTFPARIWHDFMMTAMQGLPAVGFPDPPPPETAKVPDVTGKPEEEAVKILAEANFTAVAEPKDAVEPEGTVVAQDPAGGSEVPAGSMVKIGVSTGSPPERKIPDVIGLSQAAARARLEARGFAVAVHAQPIDRKDLHRVVFDQRPRHGGKALEGTTVTILVYEYAKPEPAPSPQPAPSPPEPPPDDDGPGKGKGKGKPKGDG